MKILYVEWKCFCAEDVKHAFQNLGNEVRTIAAPKKDPFEFHQDYAEGVESAIKTYNPDVVFSMNFLPSVSAACNETHKKYVSWIYDNPHTAVYDKEVKNECNYVFTFDSYMVTQLQSRGVEHIYYAPLAVNASRLKKIQINALDKEKYGCDVAFVGSLYNESSNYYC